MVLGSITAGSFLWKGSSGHLCLDCFPHSPAMNKQKEMVGWRNLITIHALYLPNMQKNIYTANLMLNKLKNTSTRRTFPLIFFHYILALLTCGFVVDWLFSLGFS